MVGTTIHSKSESPDMYESIDAVAHALVSRGIWLEYPLDSVNWLKVFLVKNSIDIFNSVSDLMVSTFRL